MNWFETLLGKLVLEKDDPLSMSGPKIVGGALLTGIVAVVAIYLICGGCGCGQ